MQDKYAGDIGDFGKFILLKQLVRAGSSQLRIGLNWYNVANEEESGNDGTHVKYLNPSYKKSGLFKQCDPELFQKLRNIVELKRRSIPHLECSEYLPANTKYFSEPVPMNSSDLTERVKDRISWFDRSRQSLSSVDAVFLDPDNGIQTPTSTKAQARAVKYAFVDEIRSYYETFGFVIVYNHRDRSPKQLYIQKFIKTHKAVGAQSLMRILRFKRFSVRDYVFFYRKQHTSTVARLFDTLTSAPFDFLFGEFAL